MYIIEREEDMTGLRPGHRCSQRLFNSLFLIITALPVFLCLYGAFPDGASANKIDIDKADQVRLTEIIDRFAADPARFLPVDDYRLYLLALRDFVGGEYAECLRKTARFLSLYPSRQVGRDVRLLKIKALHAVLSNELSEGVDPAGVTLSTGSYGSGKDSVVDELLFAAGEYLESYPGSQEVTYIYALTLKRADRIKEAGKLFKELYMSAGRYYEDALEYVSPHDLTLKESLRMSYNLQQKQMLKESLQLLLPLLKKAGDGAKKNLSLALGDTYFRMKKYREAAGYFNAGGDLYMTARSYYRAGEFASFQSILEKFRVEKTGKSCELLLAEGYKAKRRGNLKEALTVFRRIYRGGYPCREEALWHIGWTEYLDGSFLNASYNFSDLYDEFKDSKYLYWQARAVGMLGRDNGVILKGLNAGSFYSYLNNLKSSENKGENGVFEAISFSADDLPAALSVEKEVKLSSSLASAFRRAELLSEVGLKSYAAGEIVNYRTTGALERLSKCRYLHAFGAYNESFKCAVRIKSRQRPHTLIYPIAYSEIISKVSSKYDIDPFLVLAVMREESRYDDEAFSRSGAVGLMQLMPFTAKRMAKISGGEIKIDSRGDIEVPYNNIFLGTAYLRRLIDEFDSIPLAVAAYNAGGGAVKRWLKASPQLELDEFIEDIPYDETRRYVKKVLRSYFRYISLYR